MPKELPKAYVAKDYEDALYKTWEESGHFQPDMDSQKDPFVISMPPPNATGTLHLGHAVMLAVEDIMIRFHRMKGHPALWIPGTDHAGIATQNKVEKDSLDRDGKSRHDYGRETFVQMIEKFVAGSQDTIRNQTRKMGSSCDWSRERYTLEPDLNRAVNEFFRRMEADGLIYRGDRIVNWDPHLHTTVSDDELKYKTEKAPFYTFQYGPFQIGTARPETKFGDKYVVMHPDDDRYKQYKHGDQFECEWINGKITSTVIKDEAIDMEFGTGVMTITPWHDATDFEIAERHGLDKQQIIDFDGKLLACAGEFEGMHISEARPKLVERLKEKGLLVKVDEEYEHNVSTNYRGGGIIEPQIMKQWFVDVNRQEIDWKGQKRSIKEVLHDCVESGMIEIIPNRFDKTYYHWIENLRDWCISRQLWWGHQIPMWYKVSEEDYNKWNANPEQNSYMLQVLNIKSQEERFGDENPGQDGEFWIRDPDCLDTWFSSALWTFSSLGWPDKTPELEKFHPTQVLETGYDILFFWVARMILASTYCLRSDGLSEEQSIPFQKVYLHGLVRTREGKKMSKSDPSTCIDPLEVIDEFGADALRLSLFVGSTPGNDSRLYKEKIAGYRNFVNKLWNVARYILMSVDDVPAELQFTPKTWADRWILSRLQQMVENTGKLLDEFKFSQAAEDLYAFTWNDLADWYIEITKVQKQSEELSKNTDHILLHVLRTLLKLWHPFTPYVTEELWKHVQEGEKLLMIEDWPEKEASLTDEEAEKSFEMIRESIGVIRNLRAEYQVEPAKKIEAFFVSKDYKDVLEQNTDVICFLARVENLHIQSDSEQRENMASQFIEGLEIHLPLAGMVDPAKEKKRLEKEIAKLSGYVQGLEKKLSNKKFIENAPEDIVQAEKERLEIAQESLKKSQDQLENL